jgi:hypothetical protein
MEDRITKVIADQKTTPLNPQSGNDQPESSFKKMTDAFFQP